MNSQTSITIPHKPHPSLLPWLAGVALFVVAAAASPIAAERPSDNSRVPVLSPGSGWSGPTPAPEPVGAPGTKGRDAQAIARFDVVPYQTFRGKFGVGVVAFHMNGIDRVEFAVDGGPWAASREMTLNPRTKVWEYWVELDAAAFKNDGPVEVRAVAYPACGTPRVLQPSTEHPLHLFANAGGTLGNTGVEIHVSPQRGDDSTGTGAVEKPFKSLRHAINHLLASDDGCGGASILLAEGVYTFPNEIKGDGASDRWLEITAAPGVQREKVVFSGKGAGVLQRKLHLRNLTINHSAGDGTLISRRSNAYGNEFWVDGCELAGRGFQGDKLSRGGFIGGKAYYTDCLTHDHKSSFSGPIIRNLEAYNLAGDFLSRGTLFINCHVRHMRPAKGVHPDVYQV